MSRRYRVEAIYKSKRTLVVVVDDDCDDPCKPSNWREIEEEDETDFFLYDTDGAEEVR